MKDKKSNFNWDKVILILIYFSVIFMVFFVGIHILINLGVFK